MVLGTVTSHAEYSKFISSCVSILSHLLVVSPRDHCRYISVWNCCYIIPWWGVNWGSLLWDSEARRESGGGRPCKQDDTCLPGVSLLFHVTPCRLSHV